MKKPVKKPVKKQVHPVAVVIGVLVVVAILGLLGKVFLRPRTPEAPPELQGRSRQVPEGGMMKSGGMLKSGQPTQGMSPGKAPE